jgi:hypothetical protein
MMNDLELELLLLDEPLEQAGAAGDQPFDSVIAVDETGEPVLGLGEGFDAPGPGYGARAACRPSPA